jgi:hypothetical protein
MLPTLGAVPIYLMLGPYLGPDKPQDVWGTCLQNNNVFRVTTRKRDGLLVGHVTEIPITPKAADRRPIAIKPQVINGKPNMPYMWFSCEAGHSIARIDIDEVQELVKAISARHRSKANCPPAMTGVACAPNRSTRPGRLTRPCSSSTSR